MSENFNHQQEYELKNWMEIIGSKLLDEHEKLAPINVA